MSKPDRIALVEPCIQGNARRYLEQCFETNYVSSVGPFVEQFEQAFAAYVGARYAVACATGTAAIHVALRVLGVQPSDEVFVSNLTFVASVNPILYEKAHPVLVDAERESWNLDPQRVVDEIERRARAGQKLPRVVEVVHILGHPAAIEPIIEVCDRHGVAVLEDAAEALGARYTAGRFAGRHVGTIGKIGCFSFNGNKIITTGGGGMITTDDEALARRAKHLTTQARLPGVEYWHDEVGYNYRLTNMAAALGVAQLECLPNFLECKRLIARRYDEALTGLAGFVPAPKTSWACPTNWLYSIQVDSERAGCTRDEVIKQLAEAGIEARPIWTPMHLMPMYREATRLGGNIAVDLFARGMSLPSSVSLSPEAQARVIEALPRR